MKLRYWPIPATARQFTTTNFLTPDATGTLSPDPNAGGLEYPADYVLLNDAWVAWAKTPAAHYLLDTREPFVVELKTDYLVATGEPVW